MPPPPPALLSGNTKSRFQEAERGARKRVGGTAVLKTSQVSFTPSLFCQIIREKLQLQIGLSNLEKMTLINRAYPKPYHI